MRPFTPFLCLAAIAVILSGRGALSAPLPSPVATGHSHRAKRMDGIDKVTHWLAENDGNHLEALKRLLDRTSTPETTDLHISEPSTPTQQWASSSGVSAQPALGSYDTRGYTSVQHPHPGGNPDYAGPSVAGQPHGHGIYHHDAHRPFSGDAHDRMDGIEDIEKWIDEHGEKHLKALGGLLADFPTPGATGLHVSEPAPLPAQQWASSSGVSAQPALGSYDTRGYTSVQHPQPGGKPDYAGPSVAGQPHGYGIHHHNAHWPFSGDAQDIHQPAPEQYERGTTGMESDEPAHEQALVHDQGSPEHLVRPGADPVAILSRTDLTSQQAAALIDNICQHHGAKDGLMHAGEALLAESRVRDLVWVTKSMQSNARIYVLADAALIVWVQKVYQLRLAKFNNPASYKISFKENADISIQDASINRRVDRFRRIKHKNPGSGLDSFEDHPFEAFKVGDHWLRATKAGGGIIDKRLPSSALRVTAYTLDQRPPILFGEIKVEEFKPQQ